MLKRPIPDGFAWWHNAASGGGDAHCSNCSWVIDQAENPYCRLKRHFINPVDCCINWLDEITNSTPRDAMIAMQRKASQQHEQLQAAGALGTVQAWEIINGKPYQGRPAA